MIESCLRDLGREVVTTGVMKHVIMNLQLAIPISCLLGKVAKAFREKAILK